MRDNMIFVTLSDGSTLYFEFDNPPTPDQIISAIKGIGGRPADRKPPNS